MNKVCSPTCFKSNHFFCPSVISVIESQLKYFWQIKITCKPVCFCAESPCFHTSRSSAVTCINQVLSLPEQFLNYRISIEAGRLAESCSDYIKSFMNKSVGTLF